MNSKRIGLILFTALLLLWVSTSSHGRDRSVPSPVLAYAGKSYRSVEDPEYLAYDQVLRGVWVERIRQRYGVLLDAKKYSAFDLLEIMAFIKCRKSTEPYDFFLRFFPRSP